MLGEGCLNYLAEPVVTVSQTDLNMQQKMDGRK